MKTHKQGFFLYIFEGGGTKNFRIPVGDDAGFGGLGKLLAQKPKEPQGDKSWLIFGVLITK